MLLLPQRYVFSSKSQQLCEHFWKCDCCCCYHKGTYFQANHNPLCCKVCYLLLLLLPQRYVFSSKSQRSFIEVWTPISCCCYHKGTYFQANHNAPLNTVACTWLLLLPQRYVFSSKSQQEILTIHITLVVVATTKVRIFKQITTIAFAWFCWHMLLLLPQRYVFSSKSQPALIAAGSAIVVVATTKVRIFKQITTHHRNWSHKYRCCCYHKGTYFQANHNKMDCKQEQILVVVATTKVRIFKQITTHSLLYYFSLCCCCYHKGTYFQANHNPAPYGNPYAAVVVAITKV